MEDDIMACRLWEISENLHRAELTALEHDKLVAEWVELTGGVSEQNVQKLSSRGRENEGRPESGISLAARQLPVEGKTDDAKRMNVVRALKVASLSPEAQDEAVEVGLDDNRSALLEAAKEETPEAQVATVEAVVSKSIVTRFTKKYSISTAQEFGGALGLLSEILRDFYRPGGMRRSERRLAVGMMLGSGRGSKARQGAFCAVGGQQRRPVGRRCCRRQGWGKWVLVLFFLYFLSCQIVRTKMLVWLVSPSLLYILSFGIRYA